VRPPESAAGPGKGPTAKVPTAGSATDARILANLAEMAKLLGISRAHAARLNAAGRLPRGVRLGRCVRWNVAELHAWTSAGCPARERWEAMR
jgi:excisionase family DNA binding protein